MIIDTHAHITEDKLYHKIEEVIDNANKNGVKKIIAVGMDPKHNKRAIFLSHKYKNIYPTVGIHPTSVSGNDYNSIIPYLEKEKVIAVGEIGIDLYWRSDNLLEQITFFEEQIKLAIKYNLPVIIHTRNSFNQTFEVVSKYKGQLRGVFHCFSSDYIDAKKVIDLGFYIGIAGPVTFSKAYELHELVQKIDLKHIIIETDSPYLAPVPYRGKTNEPAYTFFVAKEISKIKQIPISEVSKITTQNAIKLFNLDQNKESI